MCRGGGSPVGGWVGVVDVQGWVCRGGGSRGGCIRGGGGPGGGL